MSREEELSKNNPNFWYAQLDAYIDLLILHFTVTLDMKQSTSFGTAFADSMVQEDALLTQDRINYAVKREDKLNVHFDKDGATAITNTVDHKNENYEEDNDDLHSPNESSLS